MFSSKTQVEADLHRLAHKRKLEASKLERSTRRRTKFDFDLWGDIKPAGSDENSKVTGMKASPWIEPEVKKHNMHTLKIKRRKVPDDYYKETSLLPAVKDPLPGESYNPSFKDHQDLLWRATMVELAKEKAERRIAYHTDRMFPTKAEAPTEESRLQEMSEGLDQGPRNEGDISDEGEQGEGAEDSLAKPRAKEKTRKQKRIRRELMAESNKKKLVTIEKQKNQDVFRLKTIIKEIKRKEELTKERMAARQRKAALKMTTPGQLSACKYEEPDLDLKVSEELVGSLRELKPEGNLLTDRFKRLQQRNVIEPRVKQKVKRKSHRRKRLEKRSYKMPWQLAECGKKD